MQSTIQFVTRFFLTSFDMAMRYPNSTKETLKIEKCEQFVQRCRISFLRGKKLDQIAGLIEVNLLQIFEKPLANNVTHTFS